MDNSHEDFSDLESELRSLQPVAPSRGVHDQIKSELDAPHRSTWWWWSALPVAAAIAVGIFVFQRPAPSDHPTARFQPVATENVLYAARDEGYVTLEDGTPAHRLTVSYVDTITWKNPSNNASLQWTVPREEVRVVPVNFQ